MPWSTALKRPVPAPGGGEFKTLHDVGAYVLALPDEVRETEAWHTVAENLMQAAEHGGLWLDLARIATMQALEGSEPARTKKARRS